ncbi:MAG: hypothetical protein ABIR66_00065, partial [Saprospiraceae bacterium]
KVTKNSRYTFLFLIGIAVKINSLWDKFNVIAFSRAIDSIFKYTFCCLPAEGGLDQYFVTVFS